jgi:hypothetical protein
LKEAQVASEKDKEPLELPTVEELAAQHGVEAWALAGVRVRERWPIGFRVKEEVFLKAVERFLKGPTDGPLGRRSE